MTRAGHDPTRIEKILLDGGMQMIRSVQKDIATLLRYDRRSALEALRLEWKSRTNITRAIDVLSEMRAKAFLYDWYTRKGPRGFRPFIVGEESLRDPDLELADQGFVVLLDMVDGTDLLAKDLSNWCSAVTFYDTGARRILGALVGDAFGRLYVARSSRPGAAFYPPDERAPVQIRPVARKRLVDAYVCFYGQKPDRLRTVIERAPFLSSVKRVYNLAGNPMMIKVADGSIDAVFEIVGQAPHDVVAGAFIADKAGATAVTLDGRRLDYVAALRFPARDRLRYVVAGTRGLARSIVRGIEPPPGNELSAGRDAS